MNTYALTNLGSTLCGIVMVIGGILLLYKGAIKLEVASKDPALTVELFERQFKLTTQAPALGLFIIGLLFVSLANYYALQTVPIPVEVTPIEVIGNAAGVEKDAQVTVEMSVQWGPYESTSPQIHHVLRPHLDTLQATVTAAGYEEVSRSKPVTKARKGDKIVAEVDLGEVRLKKVVDFMEANPENIHDPRPTDGGDRLR